MDGCGPAICLSDVGQSVGGFMFISKLLVRRVASLLRFARRLPNCWFASGKQTWLRLNEKLTEVVQYIIQSEAGFYMKGVRLTAGSVQKMSH